MGGKGYGVRVGMAKNKATLNIDPEFDAQQLKAVEITWEPNIQNGTRPLPSIHKHVGYITYENADRISIAPELICSYEGGGLTIGHEIKETKVSIPNKRVIPLQATSEKTNIIGIDYEDPMDRIGILSNDDAKSLKPSIFHLLGYLVQEDEKCLWLAMATFEYRDGTIDYETPHVIPKSPILKITYFKPRTS